MPPLLVLCLCRIVLFAVLIVPVFASHLAAADCVEPCSETEICVAGQCVPRYEDCGNGSVADLETGLVWEKTDSGGGPTDCQKTFRYWGAKKLASDLNKAGCFADHCSWRLPTLSELTSIVDPDTGAVPRIAQDVFGPVAYPNAFYWSNTKDPASDPFNPYVWIVDFDDGSSSKVYTRVNVAHARVVRTGNCSDPSDTCGACGDWTGEGSYTATDALGILKGAVGSSACDACICDVNGNGAVTASDAYALLLHAVGAGPTLACPGSHVTTTTSSTSTTITPTSTTTSMTTTTLSASFGMCVSLCQLNGSACFECLDGKSPMIKVTRDEVT